MRMDSAPAYASRYCLHDDAYVYCLQIVVMTTYITVPPLPLRICARHAIPFCDSKPVHVAHLTSFSP